MSEAMPRPALELASDDLLASRAADGDTRAFAVIVRRYGRLLRAYAARVLGPGAASDDAVQEALITAWQRMPSLEDGTALKAWLIRITTRKALDAARSDVPHDDIDDANLAAAESNSPEGQAAAMSLGDALTRALDALPPSQRQVWTLRELGGYSYEEIAAELDLPTTTVRGQLARARTRLLHDLDGWR